MNYLRAGDMKCYKNFLRIDPDLFHELVVALTPWIKKQDTSMRKALEPGLKVALALGFLATGDSYMTLANGFWVATNTICNVGPEVCQATNDEYHEELIKCPHTPEKLKEVAKGFSEKWNLHNFILAIDNKHAKIQQWQYLLQLQGYFICISACFGGCSIQIHLLGCGCQLQLF